MKRALSDKKVKEKELISHLTDTINVKMRYQKIISNIRDNDKKGSPMTISQVIKKTPLATESCEIPITKGKNRHRSMTPKKQSTKLASMTARRKDSNIEILSSDDDDQFNIKSPAFASAASERVRITTASKD